MLGGLLQGWSAEPVPLLAAGVALALYWRGWRQLRRERAQPPATGLQLASFLAGVGVLLLALVSPIDSLVAQLQWVHMVQHMLIILVAPPLVVLARPIRTTAAGLQTRDRRVVEKLLTRTRARGKGSLVSVLAISLFVVVLWTWHAPALYNATLSNDAVHDFEHTSFLAAGLLFWATLVGRVPRCSTPGVMARGAIAISGLVASWLLAVYIGYAPTPLYAYHGHDGLSALSDQQLAAGVMWVPASIPFVIALIVLLIRWFDDDARAAEQGQPSELSA